MSQIIFNPLPLEEISEATLKSQIENFQTTLASLNQQIISLREALQEKDQEIAGLQTKLMQHNQQVLPFNTSPIVEEKTRVDETLTIVGALIKLYEYIFQPGKVQQ